MREVEEMGCIWRGVVDMMMRKRERKRRGKEVFGILCDDTFVYDCYFIGVRWWTVSMIN